MMARARKKKTRVKKKAEPIVIPVHERKYIANLIEREQKEPGYLVKLYRATGPGKTPLATNTTRSDFTGGFGLVPDYLSFRNTYWGQMQPVNYKLLWRAFLEDPIIRACVNIIANAIMADGYVLRGSTPLHVKRVKSLFKENKFDMKLRDVVMQLLIYGDSYFELVRSGGGLVREFYGIDAATIRIDYNEHGDVIKYIQRVLHRRVDFYPDELLHYKLDVIGGRQYGTSLLQAVLTTLQNKQAAEIYNHDYFRRGALPRVIYKIKNLSKEQLDRLKYDLRNVSPHEDIMLNVAAGEIETELLNISYADMQFKELLNYLRQNIIAALGVPPIFLGLTEGSNRANSQTQMESFDRYIKWLRVAIANTINNEFLTIANFGFGGVEFGFNNDNSREELKQAQMAQLMSSIPWVTPNEVRERMELPALDTNKFVYDPETGEVRVLSGEGDKPIFYIQQEQAEALNSPDNKNPNAANPQKKQERAEGRERQNVAQQLENKELLKGQHGHIRTREEVPVGRVEQGSITTLHDPREYARYPFGATPVETEAWYSDKMRAKLGDRLRELIEIIRNPITNAESLNHDRVWRHDKIPVKDRNWHAPASAAEYNEQKDPKRHPERDTVTDDGKRLPWLPPKGLKTESNSTITKATFYTGTDQIEELGLDAEGTGRMRKRRTKR